MLDEQAPPGLNDLGAGIDEATTRVVRRRPLLERSEVMLRVTLDDSELLAALRSFFRRMGFAAEEDGSGTLEVRPLNSVSPSYDGMTLEAYLRRWLAAHPGLLVEVAN